MWPREDAPWQQCPPPRPCLRPQCPLRGYGASVLPPSGIRIEVPATTEPALRKSTCSMLPNPHTVYKIGAPGPIQQGPDLQLGQVWGLRRGFGVWCGHSEIVLRALTWRVENNNPRFQQCQHPCPDLVPSPRGEPCVVQIAVAFPAPQATACYFTGPETISLRASRTLTASITGPLLFTYTPPSQTHSS